MNNYTKKRFLYLFLLLGFFSCNRNEQPVNYFEKRMTIITSHSWRLIEWSNEPPMPFYEDTISDALDFFNEPCDFDDEYIFFTDSLCTEKDGCSDNSINYYWSLSENGTKFQENSISHYTFEEIDKIHFKMFKMVLIGDINYKITKVYEEY